MTPAVQEPPAQKLSALTAPVPTPIVIGHRGASGHLPEHTLEAYDLALRMGADFIEPDLVMSKDGHLVARHENRIDETTDVAVKFPRRKTTKIIDGKQESGWFVEDFTLAELKTLRARERLPFRNQLSNGKFKVVTFAEVVALAKTRSAETGRTIGVYPETKHSSYFRSIDLPLEEKLVAELAAARWNTADAPVFIQSFEVGNLRALKKMTNVRLVQLMGDSGGPWDLSTGPRPKTYAEMVSEAGLKDIKSYAHGIGVHKGLVFRASPQGGEPQATGLVARARAEGLAVHVWTFRNEDAFLAPIDKGNPERELCRFIAAGVDGLFSDFPDLAVKAVKGPCGSGRG